MWSRWDGRRRKKSWTWFTAGALLLGEKRGAALRSYDWSRAAAGGADVRLRTVANLSTGLLRSAALGPRAPCARRCRRASHGHVMSAHTTATMTSSHRM